MTQRFTLEREYDATPERLFSAWTDPSMLSRWFGCGDNMLWRIHEWNPHAGGSIHVSLDFGGRPYEVKGTFTIVDPPRHLQYRWSDNETVERTHRAARLGIDPAPRAHLASNRGRPLDDLRRLDERVRAARSRAWVVRRIGPMPAA